MSKHLADNVYNTILQWQMRHKIAEMKLDNIVVQYISVMQTSHSISQSFLIFFNDFEELPSKFLTDCFQKCDGTPLCAETVEEIEIRMKFSCYSHCRERWSNMKRSVERGEDAMCLNAVSCNKRHK